MKSKALIMATLFAIFFAWSCKKEKQQEVLVSPATTTPTIPTNGTGQLKSTTKMIFTDSVFMVDLPLYSPSYMRGESFIAPPSPAVQMKISSVKVRLSKFGSPTGYVKMQLYKTTGIWGLGIQKPTGSPLATSDSINVSTLATSGQIKTFTFSGVNQYLMGVHATYFTVLYFKGGNSTNYVKVSMDNTVNTDGNSVMWAPSMGTTYGWVVQEMKDFCFWVYATY